MKTSANQRRADAGDSEHSGGLRAEFGGEVGSRYTHGLAVDAKPVLHVYLDAGQSSVSVLPSHLAYRQ
jgi:hypothetical protein